MNRIIIVVGSLLATTALPLTAAQFDRDPYGMGFKFLGCARDWPGNLPIEPIVTKETGSTPSYFVRDPVDCGLVMKEPTYKLSGDSLALSYTVYASGPVAACYCEYDSRFTFTHLPPTIKRVSFNHQGG
jgi:hypothetical protein